MKINVSKMSLFYDNNKFGERLTELRKKRWEQYKDNINKKIIPIKNTLVAELRIL
ncbi:hypothetical protein [Enterococcus cecorum]|uniref:hypothetical protein n=1 Tax=Enterococcus cecorum TaxID=44008 RepID=UPI001FAE5CA3|nr:hypothetical protein [Enterococcus cecorum]MCJ0538447.1 hypothetical protein [Enterococcus cecorum]MCJ0545250.1 hypothetical protein [Enterococcus cecorum]MCJ0550186.1 hypothetical protein [Enterococcus cecorum]MCJ0568239.1 hypothetical protein [Enterococcus cecorum]